MLQKEFQIWLNTRAAVLSIEIDIEHYKRVVKMMYNKPMMKNSEEYQEYKQAMGFIYMLEKKRNDLRRLLELTDQPNWFVNHWKIVKGAMDTVRGILGVEPTLELTYHD